MDDEKMTFDFQNLVLLIGTNPLPNYVVTEFFLMHNSGLKNIFLVHSNQTEFQEGTQKQAENLEKVLFKRFPNRITFPLVKIGLTDVSNADKTWYELTEKFIPEFNNRSSVNTIHLNYTGGTKVMCVHVYRFIENKMKGLTRNNRLYPSFSYFDGRTSRIVDDRRGIYISMDLREETRITFDDIIEMHGFRFTNEYSQPIIFEDAMSVLQEQLKTTQLQKLSDDIRRFREKLIKIRKEDASEWSGFAESLGLNDLGIPPLLPIIRAMPEQFRFFSEDGLFDCSKLKEDLKKFTNFLNGKWLEHYIYFVLRNGLAAEPGIEIQLDWNIKKNGWGTYFQLDVLLRKGFQLVGISCTITTKKATCKQRGFEIYHRTRQIGGDECKAVVITLLDDASKRIVEEELIRDSGCPEGYIKVFGERDINSDYLLKKIKEFLN